MRSGLYLVEVGFEVHRGMITDGTLEPLPGFKTWDSVKNSSTGCAADNATLPFVNPTCQTLLDLQ
jgi:hypothetical protein